MRYVYTSSALKQLDFCPICLETTPVKLRIINHHKYLHAVELMVLILDGTSDHDANAWRIKGFFNKMVQVWHLRRSKQTTYTDQIIDFTQHM